MRFCIATLASLVAVATCGDPTLVLYSDTACATEIANYVGNTASDCEATASGAGSYQIMNDAGDGCDDAGGLNEFYNLGLYPSTDCSGNSIVGGCYLECTRVGTASLGSVLTQLDTNGSG